VNKILKSNKLDDVCYDIRGPVLAHAKKMEEAGHQIIKMNIGNPAAFGVLLLPFSLRALIQGHEYRNKRHQAYWI